MSHGGIVMIPDGVKFLHIILNGKVYCLDDTSGEGIAKCTDGRTAAQRTADTEARRALQRKLR